MIAALPMYDWDEVRPATDALWALIRDGLQRRGIAAPNTLSRDPGLWDIWQSPELVIGQTCGMPYRQGLHGKVTLVGTPDYGLPDAPPGHYYSVFVVRREDAGEVEDFLPRTLAFNGQDSQSGWAAPQNQMAKAGQRFLQTLHTGAHRASAAAVVAGQADIAAIDAVTWGLICDHLPDIARACRVISHTDPTPGLPLITALGTDPAPLAAASAEAIAALPDTARAALGLKGFADVSAADYLAVPTPPPPSQDETRN